MQTDIAILGAGPGGAYAALALAKLGIPSTLVDRAIFPRTKACGDILTSNVIRALHDLDPAMVADLLVQPWAMSLKSTAFVSHKGDRILMPFHSPANTALGLPACLSARRADFDTWLLSYVRREPLIDLQEGCAVKEITCHAENIAVSGIPTRQRFHYLILALGANSPLVKTLLPTHQIRPRHSAIGLRAYFQGTFPVQEDDSSRSEFYLFNRHLMPGGLYLTPFADGGVNVNLVLRYDIFKRRGPVLQDLMQDYLRSHPLLKSRFAGAHMVGPPQGSVLFFGTHRRPISKTGCLLVGDAAGLTDATNANGIGHAMISAGIAAQTIAEAMQANRRDAAFLARYDAAVFQRLRNALFPGKVMNTLFANPWAGHLSASILQASFRRLNGRAVEELVYSKNTSRTLLDPRFYLRLFSKEKGQAIP